MNLHEAEPQTSTVEDYLQTIYSLETEGEKVISARLARWRRVTPPTAWATIHRMEKNGLVRIADDKTIHLTKQGRELAEKVARRHRLSERFLNEVLGLGWAQAHEQAHLFEHGVTKVIEDRIFEILGRPTTCPHGSPIPGTGASLDPRWVSMETLATGGKAIIKFISEELEEDNDLMEYLDLHNLRPGTQIEVHEKVPSTGVLSLRAGGEVVSLSLPVASRIRVERG
jgi:DtxR family transcriptional regulator, iron-dependent repressor